MLIVTHQERYKNISETVTDNGQQKDSKSVHIFLSHVVNQHTQLSNYSNFVQCRCGQGASFNQKSFSARGLSKSSLAQNVFQ